MDGAAKQAVNNTVNIMPDERYVIVESSGQLKQAMETDAETVIITNEKVADGVRRLSLVKKAAVVAAIGGAGVAAVNAWNPIGWGAAALTAVSGGSILWAVALVGGGTIALAILNGYQVENKTETILPDGTIIKNTLNLRKKK
ncbi:MULTISPECIES: hypothetical protein [Thalassospira]|nr:MULTISPECIES: hypothetical protein [Thalassospira]MDG4720070.1 hypothetical protein [Thalassospira sp. FZY0004]